jgi:hypothetical protein
VVIAAPLDPAIVLYRPKDVKLFGGEDKIIVAACRSRPSSFDVLVKAGATGGKQGDTAMRFMMLMIPKGYEKATPGTMPDPKAVEAMMKYNDELMKAGVLLALDGLHPPSMGARVSFAGGKPKVTDGPFAEAKEIVGGYWMIQVKSREEAIEWAKRCPGSENETIEIRQVQEMSDFPAEIQNEVSKHPEVEALVGQRKA